MTKFDPASAELHLGIIQNRMTRIKGKINAVATRLSMDPEKVEGGIDKKALEEQFERLDAEHKALELALEDYENEVLAKTAIKEPS